jgi:hypothetical protein
MVGLALRRTLEQEYGRGQRVCTELPDTHIEPNPLNEGDKTRHQIGHCIASGRQGHTRLQNAAF